MSRRHRKDKHSRNASPRDRRRSDTKPPAMLSTIAAPAWQWWLAAVIVALAAAIVYLPTLDNAFVTWDDPDYITNNKLVTEPDGLGRIWNPRVEQEQYYPLVFSSFWLEYRFCGPEPFGYHLTNLILHALNTALLVWVLRLLGASPWVAWLTAALFAVHPINVASVAWVTERKNVLSMLFYLLSFGCYLMNTRRPRLWLYITCVLLFILGLLSKTAIVTLPLTALIADRLILRRWTSRSVARVTPMLLLAFIAAVSTKVIEAGNSTSMVPLEAIHRPLVAAGAIWFYLWKLFVPIGFPGIYPRWEVADTWPLLLAGTIALLLTACAAWRYRKHLPAHVTWGAGHYVIALLPILGLIPFNYTQYSFVADHYVYLPGIGIFLAVACGADLIRRRSTTAWLRLGLPTVLALAVVATLGTITWRQCTYAWKDAESFWRSTIDHNPRCFPAQYNLANLLHRRGDIEEAGEHYRASAEARPNLYHGYGRYADTLLELGSPDEAADWYRKAIARTREASKKWPHFHNKLVYIAKRKSDLPGAERLLRLIVAREVKYGNRKKQHADALRELADVIRKQGRPDEARRLLEP